jgi:hypothetical protein
MNTKLPEVQELARRAFPGYTGRRFVVEPFTHPLTTTSYWDGGCRDYWCLINLATNRTWLVPENGTPFVNGGKTFKVGRLPENVALVRHYQGRFESVTIYLNPANIRADMIPLKPALDWAEAVVLAATRSLKSSYAGIKNYRFHEAHERTGIIETEWDSAKAACIQKGLLNRAGAITDDGRNAIEWTRLESLKRSNPDLAN